ncbi:Type 1 glutamine amidotransferase-like domain-containing protein [Streptomyces sp. NPDC021356]|uniref:Type 1 glutamine amidotransferase-like domain-containing protein n=1 Tax=Streptomyces sp. NPDC021356 TaxID=3154900 RepID=UPI0033C99C86
MKRTTGSRSPQGPDTHGLLRQMVLDRLLHADVIYVGGGIHYHLARSITGSGLADGFLEALKSRFSVGFRAGSMIFGRHRTGHSADVIGAPRTSTCSARRPWSHRSASSTGISSTGISSLTCTHRIPERDDAWADRIAARADFPVYFIDDETAVRVRDGKVNVIF